MEVAAAAAAAAAEAECTYTNLVPGDMAAAAAAAAGAAAAAAAGRRRLTRLGGASLTLDTCKRFFFFKFQPNEDKPSFNLNLVTDLALLLQQGGHQQGTTR